MPGCNSTVLRPEKPCFLSKYFSREEMPFGNQDGRETVESSSQIDDRSSMAKAMDWVSRIMTFCFAMILPALGGYFADGYLGCSPWIMLAGSVFGMVAGFYLLMKMVHAMNRQQDEADQNQSDT